jgi:hypothetical protein
MKDPLQSPFGNLPYIGENAGKAPGKEQNLVQKQRVAKSYK